MKTTRKSLIAVAVVLALAVMVTPVIASRPLIYELVWSEFPMSFDIPSPADPSVTLCTLLTAEYSTKHLVLGRPMASTNVGTVEVTSEILNPGQTCIAIPVAPGVNIEVKVGYVVPFAVVDVRNPGNGTVIATYAFALIPEELLPPGLPTPIQTGANAWLKKHGPSLTYEGYAYVYLGVPGQDYVTMPFTAVGHPEMGFDVQPGPWK